MLDSIKQNLINGHLYYSPTSVSFYLGFYGGLGNTDIREYPSTYNTYLHQLIDTTALPEEEAFHYACIGRFRDEHEGDEGSFNANGYFTNLIRIELSDDTSLEGSVPLKTSLRLNKALQLAVKSHANQVRKSDGAPYINHLLEVQDILVTVANVIDEDIIIAGLLHDVLEDTPVTHDELVQNFGTRIASIVKLLTDDKTKPLEERRELALTKLHDAPTSVKLIKLADICSNASHIPSKWSEQRVMEYFTWLDKVADACKDASELLFDKYTAVTRS
ncbi:HD domain-containing protein [Glaciecola sp. 1036]|uniref:HD domain-containing protein n=1 Tax=Alteromonadaceae TaxID=72275 RepID=UPI003D016E2A